MGPPGQWCRLPVARRRERHDLDSDAEAAQGIEELVKAGVSMGDVMGGAAKASLDLAAAGGVSDSGACTGSGRVAVDMITTPSEQLYGIACRTG